MTTAASRFTLYDRPVPSSTDMFHMSHNPTSLRENYDFFTANKDPGSPLRLSHFLDDMDLLTLKRLYVNVDLFEQSVLSNSAENLLQLDHSSSSQYESFDPDENDIDDYDFPFDDAAGYDYSVAIQERLKKANEEFELDKTSAELKHSQRVSFDVHVKAVDIVQDPEESDPDDLVDRTAISFVKEESSTNMNSPRSETSVHEYTVPLNDTQPKEGLTLLQQLKALQFHDTPSINKRWAITTNNSNDQDSLNQEDNLSILTVNSNDIQSTSKINSNSTTLKKSMIVAVNGQFDLRDEEDYTVKHHSKSTNDDNNNYHDSTANRRSLFVPAPPKEPKTRQDGACRPISIRPKSSDSVKRTDLNSTKLSSDKKNKREIKVSQRPTSAGVSKTVEQYVNTTTSGVNFDELLRKAAEKRRAELREERVKKREADEKREKELARAKESYDRWLQEKDAERKRINEEKRLERQQEEIRQVEQDKELNELRKKKYKEWLQRKNHEVIMANEFKKLKKTEESETLSESSSINKSNRGIDHRAFQRWLRRKYEQALEEKRQLHLEAKFQRRRNRRSIKRFQLQQDLRLARSYGYS